MIIKFTDYHSISSDNSSSDSSDNYSSSDNSSIWYISGRESTPEEVEFLKQPNSGF